MLAVGILHNRGWMDGWMDGWVSGIQRGHTDCKKRRCDRYALRDESDYGADVYTCHCARSGYDRGRDDDRDSAKGGGGGSEDSEPVKLARPFQHDAADERSDDCGDRGWDQTRAGLGGMHVQDDLEV